MGMPGAMGDGDFSGKGEEARRLRNMARIDMLDVLSHHIMTLLAGLSG